jgi:hypothetical protein
MDQKEIILSRSYRALFIGLWFYIFPGRMFFHFIISDLEVGRAYYQYITIFTLFLLICVGLNRSIKMLSFLRQRDYAILLFGGIFTFYNLIQADIPGVTATVTFFVLPYLMINITDIPRSIIHKTFVFMALLVAVEVIGEFIIFNNHLIGLGSFWSNSRIEYNEFNSRFFPFRDVRSTMASGGYMLRLDGIFGHIFITGGYLAVASAYLFELSRKRKGLIRLYFIICFLGVMCTTSTTAILSLFTAIIFSVFFDVEIPFRKKFITIIIFVLLMTGVLSSPLGSIILSRLLFNLQQPEYLNAFLPFLENKSLFIHLVFGFDRWTGGYAHESDLIRSLLVFGLIPTFTMLIACFFTIFKSFRKFKPNSKEIWYRAISLGALAGFFGMIHKAITIGWPVGSVIFCFVGILFRRDLLEKLSKKKLHEYHQEHL